MDRQKRPITLRQVAEQAGVSASTASLVINGKGEISEATRQRVLGAVKDLRYAPREPRSRPDIANTLCFLKIAKHGHTVNRDHSHFISDYIDGMSFEATRRDYSLQVVSHDGEDTRGLIDTLTGSDLRGVVALGTELVDEDVETLLRCGLPMVFIDTYKPFVDANFVDMDNEQAIFQSLDYLKSLGFRRIGLVSSYAAVTNFRLRHEAFLRAMSSLDLAVEEQAILSVDSTLEGAYRDAQAQLADDRTIAEAYFCANDIIAYGFIKALRKRGCDVPRDVSVIGFDNLPMSDMFEPALTSVNVPKQKIGAMAIRLLDDLIISKEPQPGVKVLVSGNLVVRKSVGEPLRRPTPPIDA
ncbi:LacI family transcriptional regulator [Aureimonas sp. SA4125]|uniref:LacI family DNA-binding transcriptional regulator n=1 Tax=Aureimonas sp. SA4125 TaxID=2826993 RepID=UPI001CC44080|nr:LacI family DNA-binding transcriptional regulator [Aureimonas sp. SA4125]BDA83169.1 LacI family transcriptional regulator [Aureimonas sp. SA4125]